MVRKHNDDNDSFVDILKYIIRNKTKLFVILIVLIIFAIRINFHFEMEGWKLKSFIISMKNLDDKIPSKK